MRLAFKRYHSNFDILTRLIFYLFQNYKDGRRMAEDLEEFYKFIPVENAFILYQKPFTFPYNDLQYFAMELQTVCI